MSLQVLELSLPSVVTHGFPPVTPEPGDNCRLWNLAITLDCPHSKPFCGTCFRLSLDDLKQFSWQPWKTYIPCDSDPEVEVQRREVTYLQSHSWEAMRLKYTP